MKKSFCSPSPRCCFWPPSFFTGIYFTVFKSMAALAKITDYSDGYNLYRMDIPLPVTA